MIVALAVKFWQWTVLIAVVIVAAIINFTDKRAKTKLKFNYKGMPKLQPVPIATKGKGFWKGIVMWLLSTRNWIVTEDWKYNIDGEEYVIPAGFQFDGASIPKFLRSFFSPPMLHPVSNTINATANILFKWYIVWICKCRTLWVDF